MRKKIMAGKAYISNYGQVERNIRRSDVDRTLAQYENFTGEAQKTIDDKKEEALHKMGYLMVKDSLTGELVRRDYAYLPSRAELQVERDDSDKIIYAEIIGGLVVSNFSLTEHASDEAAKVAA